MKNWNRYVVGGSFGITAEYLFRVQIHVWAIVTLICLGLIAIIDLVSLLNKE